MRLTPLDIRKQEFKKGMRGLDADEVYAFLSTIADEYEAVLNDNKALRERLLELDDKVQEYRNMEKTLRDTLLTAERITEEAKENARREANLIIKQAELDADKGARDIKETAMHLRQEIQSLRRQRESYMARMKMLVESHLKFLESAERDFEEEQRLQAEQQSRMAPAARREEQRTVLHPADEQPRKRIPSVRFPVERELAESSMSPPLDTPVSPRDKPLPPGEPPRRDQAKSSDAGSGPVGGTVKISDRMPAADTKQPGVSDTDSGRNDDSNVGDREWSLDRIKRDILGRRADKE